MNISDFATKYRLVLKRHADDGTDNVLGKLGDIYQHSGTELAVMFIPSGKPRTRKWAFVRSRCLAAEMVLLQDGDSEGAFSFDASNETQAAVAIEAVQGRRKRQLSPEHRMKLLAANEATRFRAIGTVLTDALAV